MRVYDTKEKKWAQRDEFFLSCFNSDLYHATKTMFGNYKMELVSPERYVVHQYIGTNDMDGNPLYEGDICDAALPGKHIQVTVAYVLERGAFYLLDYDNSNYYSIGEDVSSIIKVIGNVFDGVANLVEEDGPEPKQKSEVE